MLYEENSVFLKKSVKICPKNNVHEMRENITKNEKMEQVERLETTSPSKLFGPRCPTHPGDPGAPEAPGISGGPVQGSLRLQGRQGRGSWDSASGAKGVPGNMNPWAPEGLSG